MSFFGNNQRPDLLKNNNADNESGSRGNDTRFLGEVPSTLPDAQPSPFTTTEPRSNFGSSSSPAASGATSPDRCTNVIAQGARFKGSLKVDESVRIDGVFSGDIDAKGTIHISEGAEVDAKVHAAYVVVAGAFRGEVRADEKTELLPKSKVGGEIITKALSVHEGATMDGTIQMTSDGARPNARNGRNGASASEPEADRRNARSEANSTAG
ncbi:MAG TPA: polymer-forming cytoskeletal protein [Dehalococcoidia bacterium]|jgi:cytoskeletal protein CcmA (bactofilin family)|nr:polymer-forming cytoskeletal protein [Dehalococcoidia bacterium]